MRRNGWNKTPKEVRVDLTEGETARFAGGNGAVLGSWSNVTPAQRTSEGPPWPGEWRRRWQLSFSGGKAGDGAWGVFDWQFQLKALPRTHFAMGSYRGKLHALLPLIGKDEVKTSKFYSIRGFSSGLKTPFPQKQLLRTPLGRCPSSSCHPVFLSSFRDSSQQWVPMQGWLSQCCTGWAVADAAAALGPLIVSDRDSGAETMCWGCLRALEKPKFHYLCCSQNNLFTQNVLLGASPFWRGTEESTWQLSLSAHLLLSDLSLMRPIALQITLSRP